MRAVAVKEKEGPKGPKQVCSTATQSVTHGGGSFAVAMMRSRGLGHEGCAGVGPLSIHSGTGDSPHAEAGDSSTSPQFGTCRPPNQLCIWSVLKLWETSCLYAECQVL